MEREYTLEKGRVVRAKAGFLRTIRLMYCGMPNPDVYCIGVTFDFMHQGYSLPVYSKKDEKEIKLMGRSFSVIEVTAKKMILR